VPPKAGRSRASNLDAVSSQPSPPPPAPSPRAPRPGPSGRRPWSLIASAVLVGAEAVALIVLGGFVLLAGVVGQPASWVYVAGITGMAAAAGTALLFVARGLLAARRWSRSPAVLTQLLVLAVAYEPLRAVPAVRWTLIALAVTTVGLLFAPRTHAALID
jgi:hypothetical protein